ncbi:hypothetical protein ADK90_35425 [Streptomyces sp. XY413]|nr:hypothetical protein ADK90_35425 [Streptomyces sp. XY413]
MARSSRPAIPITFFTFASSQPFMGEVARPISVAASITKEAAITASLTAYSRSRPRWSRSFWKARDAAENISMNSSFQAPLRRACSWTSLWSSRHAWGSATKTSTTGASCGWGWPPVAHASPARPSSERTATIDRSCRFQLVGASTARSSSASSVARGTGSGR